jgi:hypothetical protein
MATSSPPTRRLIPWGFLGMLALVGALERCVVKDNLAFSGDGIGQSWLRTAGSARRDAPRHEILCFGDSMMQFGLNPLVLEDRTGRSAISLTLMGGSPESSYFLLRHAIDAGAHPSTVLVDFNKYILELEPGSPKSVQYWHELLTVRDGVELCWATRDPVLFGEIMLKELLPSLANRSGIRSCVQSALDGESSKQTKFSLTALRNLSLNKGALVAAGTHFEDSPPPPESLRMTSQWRPLPVNVHYLRKFIALAEEHNIRVIWLLLPNSPGKQAVEDLAGDSKRYDDLAHAAQRRFPNLHVIDARHMGYPSTFFFDTGHLSRDGMLSMSRSVAEVLRSGEQGLTAAGRWVVLPRGLGPANPRFTVEDLNQSSLAVGPRSSINR